MKRSWQIRAQNFYDPLAWNISTEAFNLTHWLNCWLKYISHEIKFMDDGCTFLIRSSIFLPGRLQELQVLLPQIVVIVGAKLPKYEWVPFAHLSNIYAKRPISISKDLGHVVRTSLSRWFQFISAMDWWVFFYCYFT